jgi:hypothetical protein
MRAIDDAADHPDRMTVERRTTRILVGWPLRPATTVPMEALLVLDLAGPKQD